MKKRLGFLLFSFVLITAITLLLSSFSKTDVGSNKIQLTNDTVVDYDGNVYHTVQIGTQAWMVENLKVTHYRNGVPIPNIKNDSIWKNLKTGAMCYYENDSAKYRNTYGGLYNWYCTIDTNRLCPKGWHVPTEKEWKILVKYLDSTADTSAFGSTGTDISNKLKEAGKTHWASTDKEVTNSSGFTALPGGCRDNIGLYTGIKYHGNWWSYSYASEKTVYYRNLTCCKPSIIRSNHSPVYGYSIRCIKN